MSVIRVLPESISNKIAAGEVVERPASVIKELVENAIDAGGTHISVQVERGGLSLIRVSDNGTGMSRDDALLCLERHATSKLTDETDLFSIGTLGFRGEAIPSIASVSNFLLVTRDAASEAATEITISGGNLRNVRDVGAPVGTMVEVRQLFFNVPARRKFVKSAETEMGHIADMMTTFALCRHDIHFRLSHNEKSLKNWPATARPLDRIADALGRDTRDSLYALNFSSGAITVSGWIAAPHITRRSAQRIYLFVNGRMVRDRGLQYALFEGYRGRLVKGTYPVAVISITIPFDRVDVNVHPTKSEVRFADPKRVYESLKTAVEQVWRAEPVLPWEKGADDAFSPRETEPPIVAERPQVYSVSGRPFPEDRPRPAQGTLPLPEANHRDRTPVQVRAPVVPDRTGEAGRALFFSGLTVLGQFRQTYLVCESEGEFFLIDQHAAHERVVFEKLKKRAEARQPVSQGLLVPETVELTHREAAVMESMLPACEAFGLVLERFGQNTFVVKAIPEPIADTDAVQLVQELAGKMAELGLAPELQVARDEVLAVMACHGAVRAGRRMNEQEMRALLNQMDACDNPWHCPHGRPTIIGWSVREIEKLFKRIV
ncbi:MAG: DNA mismatch repair endonuclease MutL [Thermodesulfobacteriota bacterium]